MSWSYLDEPPDRAYYPCFACGEPDTCAKEGQLCTSCEERLCTNCDKVQRARYELHTERRTLDEPLPCGKCDECCRCFDEMEPWK